MPHLNAAYTLARYLTRDLSEAEDATQEAILRAVRYFDTLRNDGDARAWLLTIVRRECYGGRRQRIDTVAFDDVPELQLVDKGAPPDAAANRSILQHRIREAVSTLPEWFARDADPSRAAAVPTTRSRGSLKYRSAR